MESYNQAPASTESNLFELQIDHESISYLGETAKWGKFLSIVGFVCCGLMVIFALFAGTMFARMSGSNMIGAAIGGMGALFTVVYLILAALWFFPNFFLFRFSSKMQHALRNNDQVTMNNSLGNLKSCFKFVGILTIVILSIYALIFLIALFAGMMR
jgi:hypothetical protein